MLSSTIVFPCFSQAVSVVYVSRSACVKTLGAPLDPYCDVVKVAVDVM